MLRLAKDLWNDQAGFIISAELVLISTVGVIGLVTGLTCVRNAVNAELSDVACAITSLDQSYSYTGFHSYKDRCNCQTKARTAGSTNVRVCTTECELAPASDTAPQPVPESASGLIIRETVISERVIGETVIGDPIPVPTPCKPETATTTIAPEVPCPDISPAPTSAVEPAKPTPVQ